MIELFFIYVPFIVNGDSVVCVITFVLRSFAKIEFLQRMKREKSKVMIQEDRVNLSF